MIFFRERLSRLDSNRDNNYTDDTNLETGEITAETTPQ